MSSPKPGHTTDGSGQGGARRGGGAGRGEAARDAGGSVCPGNNRPSCFLGHRRQLSWTSLRKHEQTKSYVNRIGGSPPAVYQRDDDRSSFLAADNWTHANLSLWTLLWQGVSKKINHLEIQGQIQNIPYKLVYIMNHLSTATRPLIVPGSWPMDRRLFAPRSRWRSSTQSSLRKSKKREASSFFGARKSKNLPPIFEQPVESETRTYYWQVGAGRRTARKAYSEI